jgi:hypothetical protein
MPVARPWGLLVLACACRSHPATGDDGKMHNFGFTTDLHLKFACKGGETFLTSCGAVVPDRPPK